jgi:transposase
VSDRDFNAARNILLKFLTDKRACANVQALGPSPSVSLESCKTSAGELSANVADVSNVAV